MTQATDRQEAIVEALRAVPLFAQLPDDEFEELRRGELFWLEPGEFVAREGMPADWFFVLLEGEVLITKAAGGEDRTIDTYTPGTFFGELPILLRTGYQASGRATRRSHLFRLGSDDFMSMLTSCQWILTRILRTMAQRVQNLQQFSQQREKLAALGTMAAGLAHELNNPAAAARRAAGSLRPTIAEAEARALALGRQLEPAHVAALTAFRHDAAARLGPEHAALPLDPLARSDREDELAGWLDDHGVAEGWELAPALVDAGLDPAGLDALARQLPAAALPDAVGWLCASLGATELTSEVEGSTGRISELVGAIKDYTYMDQAPTQAVDLHQGLENTLTILGHKLRGGVVVAREYDRSLPRIEAHGSELNQVWTNLIDNAIDAMGGAGRLTLRTRREGDRALVEIADNGPGIPPEILARIFEPFFTTKEPGKGTGLGLDISYRIVGRHGGDIRVESAPGDTRFQVRLPLGE